MTPRRRWLVLAGVSAIVLIATALATSQLPGIGAGGLLHPGRHRVTVAAPATCENVTFAGDAVSLQGWRCRATIARRGTLVYLHGVADNRTSATGVIERFGTRGFDVVAYDSRAHGESDGDVCTYGFYEKRDLSRVLDSVRIGPIVLMGTSLGAAVALQEAAADPRITGVVAAETFSDLRTIASERAPFFFTRRAIASAFLLAEQQGHFRVGAVSPVVAAATIRVPVLLIHGEADKETRPAHSERVLAALAGPKRLILVPGAGHNESLRGDVWQDVELWLDDLLGPRTARRRTVDGTLGS